MQIYNLYYGVFWVLLPVVSVAINTFFASVFGKLFGKTMLRSLPTKTLEGYILGVISTMIIAFFVNLIFILSFIAFRLPLKNPVSCLSLD